MRSGILTNTIYKISLRITKAFLALLTVINLVKKLSASTETNDSSLHSSSPHLLIYYSSTKTPTLLLSYRKSLNPMWSLLFKYFDKHLTCRFRFLVCPIQLTYLNFLELINWKLQICIPYFHHSCYFASGRSWYHLL